MSTVPTNAYALALFQSGNARSQFINNTRDLVPGTRGYLMPGH